MNYTIITGLKHFLNKAYYMCGLSKWSKCNLSWITNFCILNTNNVEIEIPYASLGWYFCAWPQVELFFTTLQCFSRWLFLVELALDLRNMTILALNLLSRLKFHVNQSEIIFLWFVGSVFDTIGSFEEAPTLMNVWRACHWALRLANLWAFMCFCLVWELETCSNQTKHPMANTYYINYYLNTNIRVGDPLFCFF